MTIEEIETKLADWQRIRKGNAEAVVTCDESIAKYQQELAAARAAAAEREDYGKSIAEAWMKDGHAGAHDLAYAINAALAEGERRGFEAGAKAQREADVKILRRCAITAAGEAKS
jgi:hypothetical protein